MCCEPVSQQALALRISVAMPPPLTAAPEMALQSKSCALGRDAPEEREKPASLPSRGQTGADALAAARLSAVRDAARSTAEAMYAAGPGKSVAGDEDTTADGEDGGGERRSRKARASYISRYGLAAYTEMLCAHVTSSEREVAGLQARERELAAERAQLQWAVLWAENAVLRRTVVDLGGAVDPCLAVANR